MYHMYPILQLTTHCCNNCTGQHIICIWKWATRYVESHYNIVNLSPLYWQYLHKHCSTQLHVRHLHCITTWSRGTQSSKAMCMINVSHSTLSSEAHASLEYIFPYTFWYIWRKINSFTLIHFLYCLNPPIPRRAPVYTTCIVNIMADDDLVTKTFNSLWPSDAIWWQIWVNIGSCNGLLPDGTKPLPEPMLTYHH